MQKDYKQTLKLCIEFIFIVTITNMATVQI
jgi:hypothetical protein